MMESLAKLLGRHIHLRGRDRVIGWMYPCDARAGRYVTGVRTRTDGMSFDVDTRNLIDWEQLFHGCYEADATALFAKLLTPGTTAIDIGANVGAHTLTFARCVGNSGRVLAFEPNPPIRTRLERNVSLNRLTNVAVHGCALGAADATLELRVPKTDSAEASNPGLASLVALETPHDLVNVEVRRLDDMVRQARLQRVDLIKIDVQGFEMQVFKGMHDTLATFQPAIVFEYEEWAWRMADTEWRDAWTLLDAAGYACFEPPARPSVRPARIEASQQMAGHMNVLALPHNDPRLSWLAPVAR